MLGLAGAGIFLAALDAYAVVTMLPRVLSDLNVSVDRIEQASPIVNGFLAGYVVAMPLVGAVSDVRGRVPLFLACLAVFALGSLVTATSQSLPWLVAGRAVAGLGGGALVPLSLAMAADAFSGRRREVALGGMSAVQEAGSVIGPVYGSAVAFLAEGLGQWRFVFWLNLPLCLLIGAGLWWGSRTRRPDSAAIDVERVLRRPALGEVDWLGAAALGVGLGLLVVALYPDDPATRSVNRYVIPLGAGAVLALAVFGWRQLRMLSPLIPRSLLRSRVFLGVGLANLLVGAALMVALVDVPILGRAVYGLDQLGSAVLLTSFLAGIPVGAVLGGFLAGRLGRRPTVALGMGAAAVCFWLMSSWALDELGRRAWLVRRVDLELALGGLGFGLVIAPLSASVLDLTTRRLHGLASSMVVLARTIGMLAGLSALTAFGLRRFHDILGGLSAGCLQPRLSLRVSCLQQAVAVALLREYQAVFLVAAGLCVLAALVALFSLRPGTAAAEPAAAAPG